MRNVGIEGVAEADEEEKGAYLAYASDTNGTLSVQGIAALKPVTIECSPDNLPDNEMIAVSAPAGFLYPFSGFRPAHEESLLGR